MPETFHLPRGAIGIDHWSGRSFPADGNGHVVLPDHIADDMKRNGALRHYDVISGSSSVRLGRGSEDDPCQGCGFNAWEFTAICPHCGHDLAEQRAAKEIHRMGNHHIHIESVGSHTNPKLYPDRKLSDRVHEVGSSEHVAHAAVKSLREHGHTVHKAHIVHHPGSPDEHIEDILAADQDDL